MIQTKTEVNSKIDWLGATRIPDDLPENQSPVMHNEAETLEQARKHYFSMMRRFLTELEALSDARNSFAELTRAKIKNIFEKYNVHFVDVDDFPRINIDEPVEQKG